MKTKKIKEAVPVISGLLAVKSDWPLADLAGDEGELAVDVYQDEKNLYLRSTIAGVELENLEISLSNDLLTIRGSRHDEEVASGGKEYFCQECYWGAFSRSVILPVEVKSDEVSATLKNGVLTVVLPKLERRQNIPIKVKEV